METQIENRSNTTQQMRLLLTIAEIVLVFLPPYLLISSMSTWVDNDPVRSLSVVWVGNITMLLIIWGFQKLRGESFTDFGLSIRSISLKGAAKVIGLSIIVCVFGLAAFVIGGMLMANFAGVPENADYNIYNYLKDNIGMLILSLLGVYIVSSFGEEVIYRAFLIDRFERIAAGSKYSTAIAVILSSVIFGLVHYVWGPMGMIQTGFMGLAMGISFIKLRRRLWILILAHAYMDTILLVNLYLGAN